jgi:hypothetical protein
MFSTGAVPVKDFLGCKVTTAKANWYKLNILHIHQLHCQFSQGQKIVVQSTRYISSIAQLLHP